MKSTRASGPFWLWPVTLAIVAWLAHSGWRLRSENESLRRAKAGARGADAPPAARPSDPGLPEDRPPEALRLEDLHAETQREIAAREAAEAKIAELEKHLPASDGEVVVSFGRIEQMGQRAAKAVTFLSREAAKPQRGATPTTPSIEEQAALSEFFGQQSEMRAMENEPREIARFLAATLRDVLGLDAAATQRATAFLETEFARITDQKLTATFRPENEPAEWDRRRDATMTDLAARLRPLLPAPHAQLPLLPGILSLGGGLRPEVTMKADGHGSVRMTLPLFPNNPGF